MDIAKYEIPADKLHWQCAPELFDFDHTKGLAPLREFVVHRDGCSMANGVPF